MKIYSINQSITRNYGINHFNTIKSVPEPETCEPNCKEYSPAFYSPISFTAARINPEYMVKKLGDGNFIKRLSFSNLAPNRVFDLLQTITKDEGLSKKFIEEINAVPQKADMITKVLYNKIGGENNFKEWYYNPNGYQRAYERYFKKEIFENDDVSVNDMVKISPNIMIDAMKQKSLRTTGDTDFIIGNVPEDIGTIEDFRGVAKAVRESTLVKEFIKFRDFMEDTESFSERFPEAKSLAINPARFTKDFLKIKITNYRNAKTPEEKAELEKEIPFLKYMNETQIEVNGKKYTYNPILRPYSTKILYSLQKEGEKNKYFVTMEMFNSEEKTCENIMNKENSCMRSDSPYLNAMVDFYLRENGCENVPDVKFYDFKSNAVIYPFIEGTSIKDESRTDKYGVVNEFSALKNEMKPLSELGVFITDCFFENFMYEKNTGKTLIVDNGHAKFSNVLKPGVKMIHMGFQDLYGRDFVSLDAGLHRAKNV